jgi:hypothetical protein
LFIIPTGTITSSAPTQLTGHITGNGNRSTAYLNWLGGAAQVDVYRNNAIRATIGNTGAYSERLGKITHPTYKVCNAGTTLCSNNVTL